MKYMLLIYLAEDAITPAEREDCYVKSAQLAQNLHAKGQFLATAPLQPVALTTKIQVRDGKALVTDGPFMETREHLGGFFLVDAKDLDEAIKIAEQIPAVRVGTVEIRPVLEVSGVPIGASR